MILTLLHCQRLGLHFEYRRIREQAQLSHSVNGLNSDSVEPSLHGGGCLELVGRLRVGCLDRQTLILILRIRDEQPIVLDRRSSICRGRVPREVHLARAVLLCLNVQRLRYTVADVFVRVQNAVLADRRLAHEERSRV